MFTALLLAGSLLPLATMLACLFCAAWLRQGRAQEAVSASRRAPSQAASARAPR